MKKEEIKKEFLKWCDEPMSAHGNDREEMFEKIWEEGEIGIDHQSKPILTACKICGKEIASYYGNYVVCDKCVLQINQPTH